jgi:hypothetical protein
MSQCSFPAFFAKPHKLMAMKFNLKREPPRDLFLELLDDRIAELDHLTAGPAIKVIVVFFLFRRFIKGITTGLKTLLDHPGLEQEGNVPVDRIARYPEPLPAKPANKFVDIKMPALPPGALQKLEPLPGQTAPFAVDKTFEFFLIFDHARAVSLLRLSLNKELIIRRDPRLSNFFRGLEAKEWELRSPNIVIL